MVSESNRNGAVFYYGVSLAKDRPIVGAIFPTEYAWSILQSMGNIVCDKVTCWKDLAMECTFIKEGKRVNQVDWDHRSFMACYFWPRQNIFGMSDLIRKYDSSYGSPRFGDRDSDYLDICLIRRNECLACCSKAAAVIAEGWLEHEPLDPNKDDDQGLSPRVHIIPAISDESLSLEPASVSPERHP